MKNSQIILHRVLAALLSLVCLIGCSAESKKASLLKRAERYFADGEYDKAKIEFLNIIKTDPKNVTANRRLGSIWHDQGAPLRALPYLIEVRELAPGDLDARNKLAMTFMSLGMPVEARKEALAILQQSPSQPGALLLLSDTSRTKVEIDEADEYLQKLPEQNTAGVHLAKGSLFVRKNDLPSAVVAVQSALTVDPKSATAHSAMAMLYSFQKKKAEAIKELKAAAELAPYRSSERMKFVDFTVQNGSTDEAKVLLKDITDHAPDYLPAWRALAMIAFSEKQYPASLGYLANIFSRDPSDYDARSLEAQILITTGESKKALEALEKLDKTYPKTPSVKYQLALAHLQNNAADQAIASLELAIAANPEFVDAILLLGELNLSKGDVQPVASAIQALLQKRPENTRARLLLAETYRLMGRLDDAAAVVGEGLKNSPDSSLSHLLLGLILRQQNKLEEARKEFDRALELTPDDLRIVSQIVDLELRSKRYDAALLLVRGQLAKKPGSAPVQFMEARIYAAQEEWIKAEAALLKTLDLDPNFSIAYDLLISTYVSANKLSPALGQLEGVLAKNPNSPRALMMSGMIHENQKDLAKAAAAYEKLIGTTPEFVPAMNNLAVLYAERLNQLDKAHDLAKKARALRSEDPKVADTLGWILYRRGEFQPALALIQESVAKRPSDPELQFHLGMASYMMGRTDAALTALTAAAAAPLGPEIKDEIQRRLALLGQAGPASTDDSPEALLNVLTQHPEDVVARMRLGESYEKLKEFGKAAATYEEALKLNSKLPSAHLKLAQLYAGPLQDKEKAMSLAKKARELAPNDSQATAIVGSLAYQSGDYNWAYSLLQTSAKTPSAGARALHDFAWAAYSLGKVGEAQQAVQRLLAEHPDAVETADAKSFLAMTAIEPHSKDLAPLEPEVQKLLSTDPNYVPAVMALAAIQGQKGDLQAACTAYLGVLAKLPDFAPAQKGLAGVYLDNPEQLGKAYEFAIKARKTLPNDPELARDLAEISYKRKDFTYALQLFQESAKARPAGAKDLFYTGMSHWQLKDKAASVASLQSALAAGLDEPLSAEAKRVIAEIQGK